MLVRDLLNVAIGHAWIGHVETMGREGPECNRAIDAAAVCKKSRPSMMPML